MYVYKQFEYSVVTVPEYHNIENYLREMGENGWELCCGNYVCLIFKRELIRTLD